MRSKLTCVALVLFFLTVNSALYSEEQTSSSELYGKIKAIPGVVDIQTARAGGAAKESYEVTIEQPLDHQKPDGEKFHQRFFVSFVGYDKPVLLGTEGYAARGVGGGELHGILGGNQVTVEHRFFGK